ncbi:MAG: HlyD family secretion protein [Chloracidobacterium sp.]|nr:HlyD family secretion protein [Chloracidobacterium sp.]
MINPNLIYLRAFVPEGKIGLVKIGQAVRVYLDSNPNQPLEAEVTDDRYGGRLHAGKHVFS